MILTEVQRALQQVGQATLTQLAREVAADPEAVRDMLVLLERRGRVHRLPPPLGCGGTCSQCAPTQAEIYAWGPPPASGEQVIACGSIGRSR